MDSSKRLTVVRKSEVLCRFLKKLGHLYTWPKSLMCSLERDYDWMSVELATSLLQLRCLTWNVSRWKAKRRRIITRADHVDLLSTQGDDPMEAAANYVLDSEEERRLGAKEERRSKRRSEKEKEWFLSAHLSTRHPSHWAVELTGISPSPLQRYRK